MYSDYDYLLYKVRITADPKHPFEFECDSYRAVIYKLREYGYTFSFAPSEYHDCRITAILTDYHGRSINGKVEFLVKLNSVYSEVR